ncbi:uncharacterized protein LOC121871140 [Homarus americanus]|uniref:uncharacterized protein LOC121871140 n=1 Tax=Homarus americanus TaxID=6706 RepID=UPI001C45CDC9|nr:uncharacterized protein LOC121871140 [Homarus americanus]
MYHCDSSEHPLTQYCQWLALLTLLFNVSIVQGTTYDTKKLEKIEAITEKSIQLCVTALNDSTKLEVRLVAYSSRLNVTVGKAVIKKKAFTVDVSQPLFIQHNKDGNNKHSLEVLFNGQQQRYKTIASTVHSDHHYSVFEISLLLKGKARIESCPEEDLPSSQPTTLSTNPLTKPVIDINKIPPATVKDSPPEEDEVKARKTVELREEPPIFKTSTPSSADTISPGMYNTTEGKEPEDGEEFIWLLGQVGSVPVLVLVVLLALVVGVVLGIVMMSLYKCCRRKLVRRSVSISLRGGTLHADTIRDKRVDGWTANSAWVDGKNSSGFNSMASRTHTSYNTAERKHGSFISTNDHNFSNSTHSSIDRANNTSTTRSQNSTIIIATLKNW